MLTLRLNLAAERPDGPRLGTSPFSASKLDPACFCRTTSLCWTAALSRTWRRPAHHTTTTSGESARCLYLYLTVRSGASEVKVGRGVG